MDPTRPVFHVSLAGPPNMIPLLDYKRQAHYALVFTTRHEGPTEYGAELQGITPSDDEAEAGDHLRFWGTLVDILSRRDRLSLAVSWLVEANSADDADESRAALRRELLFACGVSANQMLDDDADNRVAWWLELAESIRSIAGIAMKEGGTRQELEKLIMALASAAPAQAAEA